MDKYKFFILAILLLVVVAGIFFARTRTTSVQLGRLEIHAELARTNAERTKGLSGRRNLAPQHGMLFIFDEIGRHEIWMKDMRFALDIIWLDGNKNIIDIKRNARPDSYPELFFPHADAKYVVEVTSGMADRSTIHVGDVVFF